MTPTTSHLVGFAMIVAITSPAPATVTTYTSKSEWEAAAGPHSTITFTELPNFTWITEQYAPFGVHFTDGSDQIYASNLFPTDGMGLNGAFDSTTMLFDQPMTTIALDFPGVLNIKLYLGGNLFYTGPIFGGSGVGHFAGLVSSQTFDQAYLYAVGG